MSVVTRAALEQRIRPDLRILGLRLAWFQLCGYVGYALAVCLTVGLAARIGLSPVVMLAVAGVAALSFFGLAMATKIVGQEERLVSYHHQLAALGLTALTLWVAAPVLPYLDLTSLGVGTFLALGRVGCLMSGCCYGLPHRAGLAYGAEHVAGGLPSYLVGVRLVPVQALEAAWLTVTVVACAVAVVMGGAPAGSVLTAYLVAYGVGRFAYEFLRGDMQRPYWAGVSEAQWTSAVCVAVVVVAEAFGVVPWQWWHAAALACIGLAIVGMVARSRGTDVRRDLRSPRHLGEIAAALLPGSDATSVRVARTSLGIRISATDHPPGTTLTAHYAFSCEAEEMTQDLACALADIAVQLRRTDGEARLVAGSGRIYHLFIGSPA